MIDYNGPERRESLHDIGRRLDAIEGSIHSLINDHNATAKELAKRVSTVELMIAEARGMKAGVIAAFALMWAVGIAGLAAAWKWLHS